MPKPRLVEERDWGAVSPGSISRSVLAGFKAQSSVELVDPASHALAPADRQGGGIHPSRPVRVVSAERIEVIRKAVGVSVVEDQDKLAAIVDAIEGVREQTAKAFKAGVQIGRELRAMLGRLTEDEGHKALRASADLFPGWSYGNLVKMIAAAKLFDSGWVDHAILPVHYSVLYELSHLDEAGIRKAAERQLITPTLTRTEADKVRRLVAEEGVTHGSKGLVSDRPRDVAEIDAQIQALRSELRNLMARRTRAMARFRKERRKAANLAP